MGISVNPVVASGKGEVVKKRKSPARQGTTGAEDRARTGHPDLGKVVLYQMSYFRVLVSQ